MKAAVAAPYRKNMFFSKLFKIGVGFCVDLLIMDELIFLCLENRYSAYLDLAPGKNEPHIIVYVGVHGHAHVPHVI